MLGTLRIKKLYVKSKVKVPSKSDLKQEAKTAKKFMVLVKRKLQRDQVCRNPHFRKLLALVYDPEDTSPSLNQNMFWGSKPKGCF